MIKLLSVTFISTIAFFAVGCGDAADEVERTYDCAKICDKFADCYDDDLDKSECVDTCEDKGEADPDFEEQADQCEACIDDSSCVEATFDCATDCANVVSESTN
jgi:hypothetical protein